MAENLNQEYPEMLFDGFYRVLESEEEAANELGVFRFLANAKRMCDLFPGSYILMDNGIRVEYGSQAEPNPDEGGGEQKPPEGSETEGEGSGENEGNGDGNQINPDGGGGESGDGNSESGNGEFEGGNSEGGNGEEEGKNPGEGESEKPPAETDKDPEPPVEEKPPEVNPDAPEETPMAAYAKLKTVMHIREEPDESATAVTIYKTGTIVQVLAMCSNGWLKIVCPESEDGIAYVCNDDGKYANIGKSYYVVTIERDRLEAIAERLLGTESRYSEIRSLNLLTSNQTYVGMELIIP